MSRPSHPLVIPQSSDAPAEFSPAERQLLLEIAHRSILTTFHDSHAPEPDYPPHLCERRGVFTTLYLEGNLRGCVGYALPVAPLYLAVADSARAAAFEDGRFWPVTESEAPRLLISLSVLSRLFPILPDQVEVGRHGLVVSLGPQRGLLLPQVPVEHQWDRETFLEQTCRKAGLALDAWRHGASLEAFTAEVFGDEGAAG